MKKLFKYTILLTSIFCVTSCILDDETSSSISNVKHTVTFNPNNGDESYTIIAEHNQRISKPFTPAYDGYTFVGWFDEYDEKWIFSSYLVTGDLTLTAKWETEQTSSSEGSSSEDSSSEDSSGEGAIDSSGNIIVTPGDAATKLKFWMYGDSTELQVYKELVSEFNKIYEGSIEVKLQPKSADGYSDALSLTLGGSTAPDIFYVGETGFKDMAEQGMLMDISNFVKNSKDYDITNMWDSAVSRFQYDVETKTNDGPNKKFYAVPKDIGPTVIFYNETMFKNSGVKTISVDAADLDAFNNGAADDRGQTKASL